MGSVGAVGRSGIIQEARPSGIIPFPQAHTLLPTMTSRADRQGALYEHLRI